MNSLCFTSGSSASEGRDTASTASSISQINSSISYVLSNSKVIVDIHSLEVDVILVIPSTSSNSSSIFSVISSSISLAHTPSYCVVTVTEGIFITGMFSFGVFTIA